MKQKHNTLCGIDKIEGRYVNCFKIGFNMDVFVIDYYQHFSEGLDCSSQLLPNDPKLRLITSPSDARHFLYNLQAAIKKYEAEYGVIQDIPSQK
ncbi:MAG: hypothetical protein PVJ19_17200 [Desulfobacteraceae bacterium]|jgi:hypothetical protein